MLILVKPERDERSPVEFVARDGICAVLLEPWDDVLDVEDGAGRRADRVLERLQGKRAVRERQPLERVFALACGNATCPGVLSALSAPFRARDVQLVGVYVQRQPVLSATRALLLPIADVEHSLAFQTIGPRTAPTAELQVRNLRNGDRRDQNSGHLNEPPHMHATQSPDIIPFRNRHYQGYGKFIGSPIYCGKNTPIYAHYRQ